jgi:hypothetical protein
MLFKDELKYIAPTEKLLFKNWELFKIIKLFGYANIIPESLKIKIILKFKLIFYYFLLKKIKLSNNILFKSQ